MKAGKSKVPILKVHMVGSKTRVGQGALTDLISQEHETQ
jgi:hypothetical protein